MDFFNLQGILIPRRQFQRQGQKLVRLSAIEGKGVVGALDAADLSKSRFLRPGE